MKIDYDVYEKVLVMFSAGKDSWACLLHLLEDGCPREKIELWHHDIDGREGSHLMDWACTPSYVKACAQSMGVPVYFSWKSGGFEREMMRSQQKTAPIMFEEPVGNGIVINQVGGTRGKDSTRCMFPQVSANLSVRWCSAYLKIDVGSAAIRNQQRFNNSKTLVITGERSQESAARSKYAEFEPDRADNRTGRTGRHVDHWRPVHKWKEEDVWAIMERWSINPHPAYRLGWGRVSCMKCIFGSKNQWASIRQIDMNGFNDVAACEQIFGKTIHRSKSVIELADEGDAYDMLQSDISAAMSKEWTEPIFLESWQLPKGAFGESCGPI